MQHYGVPTRILDLTTNALVALYFACKENKNEEDGEVLVFDIPDNNVCYSDSDKVTILANLAKCDKDFSYSKEESLTQNERSLLNNKIEVLIAKMNDRIEELRTEENDREGENQRIEVEKFSNFINQKESNLSENFDKFINEILENKHHNLDESFNKIINKYYTEFLDEIDRFIRESKLKSDENTMCSLEIKTLSELKERINQVVNECISDFNKEYFGKLLHYIREDKSYFLPIINPNNVDSIFAVRPKLDNPRIMRQHGAFLIFGIEESSMLDIYFHVNIKVMPKVNKDWILRGDKGEESKKRIIINKKHKGDILEELEILGISDVTLFPEIDKVAEYVREKFKRKQEQ